MADPDDPDTTPTPSPPGGIAAGTEQADIASTGIALATVATRLRHQADLADAAAERCREAARVGEGFSAHDRGAALRDVEEGLGTLAEAIHDTRRALRSVRLRERR